mgnify:CR=1 FL=1
MSQRKILSARPTGLKLPKGTLRTVKFRKHEKVTATTRCKKHGFLYLIGAQLLDRDTVLASYGRMPA